jgi:hypothetical protein
MADIKLSTDVKPAIGATANNKSYELFQSGTEVVPLASGDHTSVAALTKQVGTSIGSATVVGGVLQLSLSKAAEGRCSLRSLK